MSAGRTQKGLTVMPWVMVGALLPTMALATPAPIYEDITESLGLHVAEGAVFASGWMDLTMDGSPDPYFITDLGLIYLAEVDGVMSLQSATMMPEGHTIQITVASLSADLDRDGVDELVTVGRAVDDLLGEVLARGWLEVDSVQHRDVGQVLPHPEDGRVEVGALAGVLRGLVHAQQLLHRRVRAVILCTVRHRSGLSSNSGWLQSRAPAQVS